MLRGVMKRLCLSALLISMMGQASHAQTVAEGIAAAKDGRFSDALTIWKSEGSGEALRNIGGLYLAGVLGSTDLDLARTYFENAAELGDAQAMLSLGYMHLNGMGMGVDAPIAEDWFRKAGDLGLAEARFMWARSVLDRKADDTEINAAIRWLKDAAEAGVPKALTSVGDLLRTGTYTERNVDLAVDYYRRAGALGESTALKTIGDIYLFAELGDPDIPKAIEAYRSAADSGNTDAMYSLAYLFYMDPNSNSDTLTTAFDLAKTAAFSWHEQAQWLLGQMYLSGRGGNSDAEQAYFWLDLAASAGVIEAHHLRALAFSKIGADTAAKLHDKARAWFDNNHSIPHSHRGLGGKQHVFK